MKKLVLVLGVLVAIALLAPWGIGKLAERRLEQGLVKMQEVAPYLRVVDRKWQRGWFRSEQEVTIEVVGPWMRSLNPVNAIAEAAMREQYAGANGGSPNANAETPSFTLRNKILHGPVLGFSGLGVARVDSQLVLSAKLRKELEQFFGTDDPVRVSTRVHFFGGATTTLSGEARSVDLRKSAGVASWDEFAFKIVYSGNLDSIDVDGAMPSLEIRDSAKGSRFLLKDLSVEMDSDRLKGQLYDTDAAIQIDKLLITDTDRSTTEIRDLRYAVDTNVDGDFLNIGAKFGSGAIKGKMLQEQGFDLKEVHYDFTMRRLHTETFADLMKAVQDSYVSETEAGQGMGETLSPIKEYGLALFKYDPELVIDRIGVVTADGSGYLTGKITFKGVTERDFAGSGFGIIGKMDADLLVKITQKLLDKLPNGTSTATSAIESGYLKREGDAYVSELKFKRGQLTINGKAQELPGFSGATEEPRALEE